MKRTHVYVSTTAYIYSSSSDDDDGDVGGGGGGGGVGGGRWINRICMILLYIIIFFQ